MENQTQNGFGKKKVILIILLVLVLGAVALLTRNKGTQNPSASKDDAEIEINDEEPILINK